MSIIGIVLGTAALSLIYWLRKDQTMDSDLHSVETDHIHQGMNALMNDFNHYQVETDRKIADLEKQLEIKSKKTDRQIEKLKKDLPIEIRKVVGYIEFAKPLDKK